MHLERKISSCKVIESISLNEEWFYLMLIFHYYFSIMHMFMIISFKTIVKIFLGRFSYNNFKLLNLTNYLTISCKFWWAHVLGVRQKLVCCCCRSPAHVPHLRVERDADRRAAHRRQARCRPGLQPGTGSAPYPAHCKLRYITPNHKWTQLTVNSYITQP